MLRRLQLGHVRAAYKRRLKSGIYGGGLAAECIGSALSRYSSNHLVGNMIRNYCASLCKSVQWGCTLHKVSAGARFVQVQHPL